MEVSTRYFLERLKFIRTNVYRLSGWSAPSCIATAGAGAGGQIGTSDIYAKANSRVAVD
jgi:lipid-binding SYLF domain-containing protein